MLQLITRTIDLFRLEFIPANSDLHLNGNFKQQLDFQLQTFYIISLTECWNLLSKKVTRL